MDGIMKHAERLKDQFAAILIEEDEGRCFELKNEWFIESLVFLLALPDDIHCWCQHYDIVWRSLEPFYNMPCDRTKRSGTVVEDLWERISKELAQCILCVKKHHDGLQTFCEVWQDGEHVSKLSAIMERLETDRVAGVVTGMWGQIEQNQFDIELYGKEKVISLVYEVLSYPWLLDDAEIYKSFGKVLRYLSEEFNVELADGEEYAGVYWLLFHSDQNVRMTAHGLIKSYGNFRTPECLEKVQPLLKKCIDFLDLDKFDEEDFAIDVGEVADDCNRRKTTFGRFDLWKGMCQILDLVEPPALEAGIVEKYPSFIRIVVNRVSEASAIFWNALKCLKILLEKLGYSFWLHSPCPALVRNSLLIQCHQQTEEQIHSAIFDLFTPFIKVVFKSLGDFN